MRCICMIYKFLDNATIAALLAVLVAGFLARFEYRKQKELERRFEIKKDIIDDIICLQEKVAYALLIIDRIANSYKNTMKNNVDFLEALQKYEIPRLSDTINEVIPAQLLKISIKLDTHFGNNIDIVKKYDSFKTELKLWHDTVVSIKFDARKRVEDQSVLSKEELNKHSKLLIDVIWKEN